MRVLVQNLPLQSYVNAWVEVPDGTTAEEMQGALADKIVVGSYKVANPDNRHDDLDEGLVRGGWEFQYEVRS